ncbi:hypothetical protein AVEN_180648-1 [Araneus ventricosus]|uniref:Uncharacterized protein n=1 Tax=Araneus ventricosus TaxID=182803 RepID=A0A4Y2ICT7_ARAVE|nr:hypothetical protein AVEN_180648-1 [Araneus ventricosus]
MTMDLTLMQTQRKSFRTSFTISDKFACLDTCQTEITNLILKVEDAEQAYEEDFLSAEKYRYKYTEICSQIGQMCLRVSSTKYFSEKRKFKFLKIELKRFDGDAKSYLTFWNQFRKIYEDASIPNEDKLQCLLQAVVPKSKAARVNESFPATADNYTKAISQLQERFGRDDLLVQIYEVLVAWERSRNHSLTETKESRTLEQLMNFLRQEVKGEEMVNLARTGFASHQSSRRKELHYDQVKQSESTTASALDREERVSDYDKMIRIFAWILRFVNNCKVVIRKCKDSELSQSEIEYSEKNLIRFVQSYYLSDAKSSNFIETFLEQ